MPKAKKKTPAKIFDEGEPKFGNVSAAEEPSAAQVLAEAAELAKPAVDEYKNKVARQMVEELEAKIFCNHRNLHAQPEALCILEPGHEGNHSDGKYAWSDAAGTPVKKGA
jgi:hypothetical protein